MPLELSIRRFEASRDDDISLIKFNIDKLN